MESRSAPSVTVAQLESFIRWFNSVRCCRPAVGVAALTTAYEQLEFAGGFARLGAVDRSRQLWDQATPTLLATHHPVHTLLVEWYGARIRRAVEDLPLLVSAEVELAQRRLQLSPFERHRLDRLRQHSRVLEPDGDLLDPTAMFMGSDQRLVELETIDTVKDLTTALDDLLQVPELLNQTVPTAVRIARRFGPDAGAETSARLWHDASTRDAAYSVIAALARAARGDVAAQLADRLEAPLTAPMDDTDHAAAVRRVAVALRDAGREDRAHQLVDLGLRAAADPIDALQVGVAAAALGCLDDARGCIWAGLRHLADAMPTWHRIVAVRAIAEASSYLPQDERGSLLWMVVGQMPATEGRWLAYGTSDFFELRALAFIDAMTIGFMALTESQHLGYQIEQSYAS